MRHRKSGSRSVWGKIGLSMLVVGMLGVIGGIGTWAAFSATTGNSGNSFTAGTVTIGDDDTGAMFVNLTGLKPGDAFDRCIRVTYTGDLGAGVKLYGSVTGSLAPYLNLSVTRGSKTSGSAFPSCSDFTPDAGGGALFTDRLSAYPTGYDGGIADPGTSWAQDETHVYRFRVTVSSDNDAQGKTATTSFTWEARNN